MTILRDIRLRELIGRTDAEFERRAILDQEIDRTIFAFRDRISGRFEVAEFDTTSAQSIRLNYDFAGLASDSEFLSLVSHIDFLTQLQFVIVEGQIKDIELLRDELAARMGGREAKSAP